MAKNEIKEIEVTMIDKGEADAILNSKKAEEDLKLVEVYKDNISSLKKWIIIHEAKLKQIDREILLKSKAPLPLEKTHDYENLLEWEEHAKESIRLALETEKLQIYADLHQVNTNIKVYKEQIKEIGE